MNDLALFRIILVPFLHTKVLDKIMNEYLVTCICFFFFLSNERDKIWYQIGTMSNTAKALSSLYLHYFSRTNDLERYQGRSRIGMMVIQSMHVRLVV